MSIVAGISRALRRLGRQVKDPMTRDALIAIEEKVLELDLRMADLERRVKTGGL